MPLQNRVTPEGEIVAIPERGTMMGNRGGCLHLGDKTLGRKRWSSRQWICCRLEFNGRRREVMDPGSYTELFFLDEATALAAGHRPCFECRREDAVRFAKLWATAQGGGGVRMTTGVMDQVLHSERVGAAGDKRVTRAMFRDLPAGTMVRGRDGAQLILDDMLLAWTPGGYGVRGLFPPKLEVEVLTPPCIISVLNLGYQPMLHATARNLR